MQKFKSLAKKDRIEPELIAKKWQMKRNAQKKTNAPRDSEYAGCHIRTRARAPQQAALVRGDLCSIHRTHQEHRQTQLHCHAPLETNVGGRPVPNQPTPEKKSGSV